MTNLSELKDGQSGIIKRINDKGPLNRRIRDLGIIPGKKITLIKKAPLGDPIEIKILDFRLTLRGHEAEKIQVEIEK